MGVWYVVDSRSDTLELTVSEVRWAVEGLTPEIGTEKG